MSTTTEIADHATTTISGAPANPAAPSPAPLPDAPESTHTGTERTQTANDDQWQVQSLQTTADAEGRWAGTAVIHNRSGDTRSTGFIFTMVRDDQEIATLTGTADAVPAGQTATVQLASADRFSSGAASYRFETGFAF